MDRTVLPMDKNLLASSWSAKLPQAIPDDYLSTTNVMNKLRRESVKNFLKLSNLNRQFSSQMQYESNRLEKERMQLIRRHEQLRRRSELQKRSTQKMKDKIRCRSRESDRDFDIFLPKISALDVNNNANKNTSAEESDSKVATAGQTIDTDDHTFVKVYKRNGIFKPQSLYISKQKERNISKVSSKKDDYKFELINFESEGKEKPNEVGRNQLRKKKGLQVTWSSLSNFDFRQAYRADDMSSSASGRADDVSTPSTIKSVRSDSFLLKPQYRANVTQIESIGIHWNLPQGLKIKRMSTTIPGQLSRNIVPVTSGLEREGTSVSKLKWDTKRTTTSLTSSDAYKVWLSKLELLKNPTP